MGSDNGRHLWQRPKPKLSLLFGIHRHDVSAPGRVGEELTFFLDHSQDEAGRTWVQTKVDIFGRNQSQRCHFWLTFTDAMARPETISWGGEGGDFASLLSSLARFENS